jgi:hypothetical protein
MKKPRIIYDDFWRKGIIIDKCCQHPQFPVEDTQVDTLLQFWRTRYGVGSGNGLFMLTELSNKLNFKEGSGPELTATFNGGYPEYFTGASLAAEIQFIMRMVGTLTYVVTYSESTGKFTISAESEFSLLWNTGTNKEIDISDVCGFSDLADDAGGTTYTSDYKRIHYPCAYASNDLGSSKEINFVGILGHNISQNLGPELIVNGDFATDLTGWSGANWAWSAGTALHTAGSTGALSQASRPAIVGKKYKITYMIGAMTAGTLIMSFGGVSGAAKSENGTYTEYVIATSTAVIAFTPSTDFNGSLDNISLKENVLITLITASNEIFSEDLTETEITNNLYNIFFFLLSSVTNRYAKIRVSDPTNAQSFIQIGHIILGYWWEIEKGIAKSYSEGKESFSSLDFSDSLVSYAQEKPVLGKWNLPFKGIGTSSKDAVLAFFDEVEISKAFVICLDYEAPNTNSYWVQNVELVDPQYQNFDNWDWGLVIREVL